MKIWSTIENTYHKRPDGLYQEVVTYYVHFKDDQTDAVQTKLDKAIYGDLFTVSETHNSMVGRVASVVEDGVTKRLIAVTR